MNVEKYPCKYASAARPDCSWKTGQASDTAWSGHKVGRGPCWRKASQLIIISPASSQHRLAHCKHHLRAQSVAIPGWPVAPYYNSHRGTRRGMSAWVAPSPPPAPRSDNPAGLGPALPFTPRLRREGMPNNHSQAGSRSRSPIRCMEAI